MNWRSVSVGGARNLAKAREKPTEPDVIHEIGCSSGVGQRCTCESIRRARLEYIRFKDREARGVEG
jgi:hypothetical protein